MFLVTSASTLFWPVLTLGIALTILTLFTRFKNRQRHHTSDAIAVVSFEKDIQMPNYSDVFPPFQRHTLPEVSRRLPIARQRAFHNSTFNQAVFEKSLIGLEHDYQRCQPTLYNFTGFTVAEIRALGAFPDYAKLSGVPLPMADRTFVIEMALPRPYRPFRWPYHQTMSLSKMDSDYWIELESTYKDRIQERKALYQRHDKNILQYLPGAELACKELMEMALQFLCARYPHYFALSENGKTFTNKILDVVEQLEVQHPLIVMLNHIPEDFALMLRNPENGCYYLRAGVICSTIGWHIGQKMGRSLQEIHTPVPDYREKMQLSMDRFFTRMPTSKPIQRGSWGFEVGQPFHMPPGDERLDQMHTPSQDLKPEDIYFRVDWQTLRRLPLSGAVVFNFKALFTPITEFRDEPYIPSLVHKLLGESDPKMLSYKHASQTEHVVRPLMAQYEREQMGRGLIEKDWTHQTLEQAPFFRGWVEKWQSQQKRC